MRIMMCLVLCLAFMGQAKAAVYTVGGSRPATLQTPPSYDVKKTFPLILFLHGYSGNSEVYRRYLDLNRQFDALQAISIVPNGTANSQGLQFWNATPECCDFEKSGVDDVGYIKGLIVEATQRFAVDPKRVYVFGHSNGGFMGYRLACEIPELIHGVVSISGAFFADPKLCKNPAPIRMLQIHGDADDTVPYGGTQYFPSARQSIGFWENFSACKASKTQSLALDLISEFGSSAKADTDILTLSDCEDGREHGLWTIRGGSHAPGFIPQRLFSEAFRFIDRP